MEYGTYNKAQGGKLIISNHSYCQLGNELESNEHRDRVSKNLCVLCRYFEVASYPMIDSQ